MFHNFGKGVDFSKVVKFLRIFWKDMDFSEYFKGNGFLGTFRRTCIFKDFSKDMDV